MPSLDWLKQWDLLIGMIITFVVSVVGVITFFDRRAKSRADATKIELRADTIQSEARVGALERQLGGLSGQMSELKTELREVDDRVNSIERGMETVARTEHLHALAVAVGRLEATTVQLAGKLDTIYRAAVEAGAQKK